MKAPRLDFAPFVSREHGEAFAAVCVRNILHGDTASYAFAATKIITFPDSDNDEALDRYGAIADEIRGITLELTRPHLAEIFTAVAAIVLDRERGR